MNERAEWNANVSFEIWHSRRRDSLRPVGVTTTLSAVQLAECSLAPTRPILPSRRLDQINQTIHFRLSEYSNLFQRGIYSRSSSQYSIFFMGPVSTVYRTGWRVIQGLNFVKPTVPDFQLC